jgi:hypothetical protein
MSGQLGTEYIKIICSKQLKCLGSVAVNQSALWSTDFRISNLT